MHIQELTISGAFEITPISHKDDRGVFAEWFKASTLEAATGRPFVLRQANVSVSKANTFRGVHSSSLNHGQAKYVTCVHGSVIDYVIDLRVGSPTFSEWTAVELDDDKRNAVFLSEGLGHAFLALTEGAVVSYLVSNPFSPTDEFGINPLDPDIGLTFDVDVSDLILSPKDIDALSLAEAQRVGKLPSMDEYSSFQSALIQEAK